ncbi:MAG: TrbG/VirB9 family P-type conjugative transfer protein [Candidatus Acidiferrales bacterium]
MTEKPKSPAEEVMNWNHHSTRMLSLVVLSAILAAARTSLMPPIAWADTGARTVEYAETEIIPIRAKIRFSTLIVLPANEEILDATTGDKEFWIINGVHNLCYLHPARQGIRSNLNLITATGHVYSFLLTEISNDVTAQPDLKVFVERKEQSPTIGALALPPLVRASDAQAYKTAADAARAEAAQQEQAAEERAQKEIAAYRAQYAGKLSFDYSFDPKGARSPFSISAIYHDDKFTYIKSTAQEKPTIYELKDGKPNLINFELSNGIYVIPKILDNGYLAIGKKKLGFLRHGA